MVEAWIVEWCDPDPWLYAYVCEQFVSSPFWSVVFLADMIAAWVIVVVLYRQRQYDKASKNAYLTLSRAARARRLWQILGTVSRLTSLTATTAGTSLAVGHPMLRWKEAWDRVAVARKDRKHFLERRDFHLPGVIGRAIQPWLAVAVTLLIALELHAFFIIGVPWFEFGDMAWCIVEAFGVCFSMRIYIDYARTSLMDPGSPGESAASSRLNGRGDMELGSLAHETPRCRYCRGPKPPRTHHCRVCRRCVLKMDHHCPFVNNCIGERNYKHFLMFLAELVIGCIAVSISLAPQVPYIIMPGTPPMLTFARRLHVGLCFLVAVIFTCLLGPFFYLHFQLLLINQTTLEQSRIRERIQTRKNSSIANAKSVSNDSNNRCNAERCGSNNRGAIENFADVCGAPPAKCRHCLEWLFLHIVPGHVAKMAKRNM
mmetsp:Transcript_96489/g.191175  ORF Transcript_96489/g.191175 Transcript_96489/m.191175 type:complete len:428 (+) Transcript_96489:97-1380(+)